MSKLASVVIFLSALMSASTMIQESELYFFTPKFIVERMVEESFDDELKNITAGRSPRNIINEVESEDCSDTLGTEQCLYLRSFGSCFRLDMWASMKSMCKLTCKFCQKYTYEQSSVCLKSKFGCCPRSNKPAAGPNKEGCKDICFDSNGKKFCKTAKKLGLCNQKRTLDGCLMTCGYCRQCIDIVPMKCAIAAKFKGCQTLTSTINYCRKTCNYCGKRDPCFGHVCKGLSRCSVGKDGKPKCVCRRKCHEGDKYTGRVCGRDGTDYQSLCHLKQAQCKYGKPMYVKKFGPCRDEDDPLSRVNCSIKEIARCATLVRVKACITFKKRMIELCPHSCGYCGNNAPAPKFPCYHTKYGCCLDDKTTCRGMSYEGCPFCQDRFRYLCKRFVSACGDDRNKGFMKINCPKQCHYCRSNPRPRKQSLRY